MVQYDYFLDGILQYTKYLVNFFNYKAASHKVEKFCCEHDNNFKDDNQR